METQDTIIHDRESAARYDRQAQATNWLGPEVVFGLAYEFVRPGETLLDLGIGSGLSSILFHRAGLRIHGLDGSPEVLEVCKAKGFAEGLTGHDLRELPLPYPDGCFDHAVCVAVLNSFRDLDGLFRDIARIMRKGGIFAFTVERRKPGEEESYPINPVKVSEQPDEEAVRLFRHSDETIAHLLEENCLEPLKALEFAAFSYPAENRDVFFKAWVTRKQKIARLRSVLRERATRSLRSQ